MIENPEPEDWRELQNGVCRLFNEIGLTANTEVELATPRGKVEVDVFAVDESSVDNIRYIVECKNWKDAIPKSVVHSFTTVMHETGVNIGFIISRQFLQSGAKDYTKSTNIIGLTYQELQNRYFKIWWSKFFSKKADEAADSVRQYVEPFNSYRDRLADSLSDEQKHDFRELQDKYFVFATIIISLNSRRLTPNYRSELPPNIELFKTKLGEALENQYSFKSVYYRDLLYELCEFINLIEEEFNTLFGKNIFKDRKYN